MQSLDCTFEELHAELLDQSLLGICAYIFKCVYTRKDCVCSLTGAQVLTYVWLEKAEHFIKSTRQQTTDDKFGTLCPDPMGMLILIVC